MPKKPVSAKLREVQTFINNLKHPMKMDVQRVRNAIHDCMPGITEQLKWKAPSFIYEGDDRITFNFTSEKNLKLILHRGAKVKDASDFNFEDTSGLIVWKAKDRGEITLSGTEDVSKNLNVLTPLFRAWFKYTAKMD
ncbi:MAG: DUF1801 domain-containing protein [Pseudobdellovibrio sp.]